VTGFAALRTVGVYVAAGFGIFFAKAGLDARVHVNHFTGAEVI
jgi:hypothetical protein